MSPVIIFAILVLIFTFFKLLNVTSPPRQPRLVCSDSKFLETVIKHCPHLLETYIPVRLWGSSGHMQTLVHATLGRTISHNVAARRVAARQKDGATVTWDVYENTEASIFKDVYTLAICPGIANSSESAYVRALVALACQQGFRCVVLNHLGVLNHVKLTSPRVFRYGATEDLRLMLSKVYEAYPTTRFLLVGFSMGGNIVCKYLGEQITPSSPSSQRNDIVNVPSGCILGAVSICQAYDAVRTLSYLLGWGNLARIYLYSMTENMRSVILRNRDMLLSEEVKKKFNIDEKKVLSAATLPELDEVYTRRVHGFRSTDELYQSDSSAHYLHNITVPLVFVNAKDDPLMHHSIYAIPCNFAETHNNSLYIETEHGGHLGFYDGGIVFPEEVTWLDRTLVGLVTAMAARAEDTTCV